MTFREERLNHHHPVFIVSPSVILCSQYRVAVLCAANGPFVTEGQDQKRANLTTHILSDKLYLVLNLIPINTPNALLHHVPLNIQWKIVLVP